jgi:hypothetical protein
MLLGEPATDWATPGASCGHDADGRLSMGGLA